MKINELVNVSKYLKSIRLTNHMTQEEFAAKLGIKRTTYANYENGTRNPSLKFLMAIKDVFGYDIMQDISIVTPVNNNKLNCKSQKEIFFDLIKKTIEDSDKDNYILSESDIIYLHKQWECLVSNFLEYRDLYK